MIPARASATGFLPQGRYAATLADVENEFVKSPAFSGSATRASIWSAFEDLLDELRKRIPVAAVWLAGSFITSKQDPNDLDVQFWFEDDLIRTTPQPDGLLSIVASSRTRSVLKVPLDTYVGIWRCIPQVPLRTADDDQYYWTRGHWDDWWQRSRSGAHGAAPVRADTLPVRGYLEVMIDGYQP